jgi:hypothetical protein
MAEQTEFNPRVVTIGPVTKHPGADTLSLTNVDGFPVVIKTGAFKEGDTAVYVPVDALVPTSRPEFAFLAKTGLASERHRVRAARLRGVFSMGLLVPATDADALLPTIEKYVSPQERALEESGARTERQRAAKKAGGLSLPVYGLDSGRKYLDVLEPGEEIVVTEKIHGCNARYCYTHGRLWVGSHKVMRGCSPSRFRTWFQQLRAKIKDLLGLKHRSHLVAAAGDVWWETAEKYGLKAKLAGYPDLVVYGEIYGDRVQDLTYGCSSGERKFRVFDILDRKTNQFMDWDRLVDMVNELGLELVPVVGRYTYATLVESGYYAEVLPNGCSGAAQALLESRGVPSLALYEDLWKLAEGKSLLAPKQIREGVVVKPVRERVDPRVGRVALKLVGQGYLLRGGA